MGINGFIHHTPGHSKGSISIELDNGEAIIGDLMMGGYLGGTFYPQLPGYHYFIDNMDEVRKSIRKTMNFKSEKFYVGHGGPLSRKLIEKRFKNILL